jgi:hypothetical protein
MIRFVIDSEARLVPDLAERVPGRGVWLTADRDAISAAVAGHAFARAVRRSVSVPVGLLETIEGLLRRRCIEGLGLARRAGVVVAGFEQVAQLLRAGEVGLLLVASDAAPGQRRRLERLAKACAVASVLRRDELGAVFGRDELTYAALGSGRLAERLMRDLQRLAGVSGQQRLAGPSTLMVEGQGGDLRNGSSERPVQSGVATRRSAAPVGGNGSEDDDAT